MFHTLNPFLSNRVPVLVEVGRELGDPEPHLLYIRARVGLLRVCVCQSLEDADRVIASGTHPSSARSPLAGGCTGHERGKSGWLPAVTYLSERPFFSISLFAITHCTAAQSLWRTNRSISAEIVSRSSCHHLTLPVAILNH